jgi:hypothetical protein
MKNIRGTITPALLIITSAFMVVIYGLILVLTTQLDFSHRQIASEQALNIAEAGVNYYRWHLAHAPNDFQDGTQTAGPYVHSYRDPQGSEIGQYSLTITPPTDGSTIVTIKSIGWTNKFPNIKRTITAQYGKASFAKYVFLNNASVWYGPGITVYGDVHSNNGVRMDGTNLGKVTSSKDTYMCGSETGCSPPTQKPGVWGSGGDQSLWRFPVASIDFDLVSFDFALMKTQSQTSGLYLAPSNRSGYHYTFASNGTVNVKKVLTTSSYQGYSVPGEGLGAEGLGGCRNRNQVITSEQNIGTYNVADKPIIFAEDNIWIEGVVKGKVTVVAAGFPISSQTKNVFVKGNVTYDAYDGTNTLGLIAQNDIYFTRDIPTDFIVDGALMAQKGRVLRHGYLSSCGSSANAIRNKLTINGALLSYGKSYWNYGNPLESGFITREVNYDTRLLYSPPPYFPTSSEYEFISWEEK